MPIKRGHFWRDIWAGMIAKIDAQIAELEPVAMQLLGSIEQRRALIELTYLRLSRDDCLKQLKWAIEGVKPTK